ncbi:hypothetical protein BDV35DRAFT_384832 [Aspergillus flavus]|uniref:Uncharacterized protein n=1 Tax=Aspergillus flavus TaxID=5059 RepID=A0A5N6GGR5_ASPFL|nr:hypothetical protein BDV35DRAFT_384832 [Aspergillus flavus]
MYVHSMVLVHTITGEAKRVDHENQPQQLRHFQLSSPEPSMVFVSDWTFYRSCGYTPENRQYNLGGRHESWVVIRREVVALSISPKSTTDNTATSSTIIEKGKGTYRQWINNNLSSSAESVYRWPVEIPISAFSTVLGPQ